jgi:glucose uptake protein GlcU
MSGLGYIYGVLSAVGNGTFAALSKLVPDMHPVHFNALLSVGTFICSLVVTIFNSLMTDGGEVFIFQLDLVAMLSGLLFFLANLCAFFAIPRVGVALAQGVWGGTALVISFFWGTYGPAAIAKPAKSIVGAYAGLILVLVGIVGLAQSQYIKQVLFGLDEDDHMEQGLLANTDSGALENADGRASSLSINVNGGGPGNGEGGGVYDKKDRVIGISFALLTGIIGGSILVPNALGNLKGLDGLFSFGTGAILAAVVITPLYFVCLAGESKPSFPFLMSEIWPGIVAGIIWQFGNVMCILAIKPIGFAVAGPLQQCGLLVSGLLGIFMFKEITGRKRIGIYFAFSFVLIVGAFVLSAYH